MTGAMAEEGGGRKAGNKSTFQSMFFSGLSAPSPRTCHGTVIAKEFTQGGKREGK
jgi:hypothetical protein